VKLKPWTWWGMRIQHPTWSLIGSFEGEVNYFKEGSERLKPTAAMPGVEITPIKKEHGGLSCREKGKLK
jgi:hypothetical protein